MGRAGRLCAPQPNAIRDFDLRRHVLAFGLFGFREVDVRRHTSLVPALIPRARWLRTSLNEFDPVALWERIKQ
jgi:hypothetical protein